MSRPRGYRIGGTCSCAAPTRVEGAGPYGATICGRCGRLFGAERLSEPAVDLGPTEPPGARETGPGERA
jgi:hypothetical protein